MDDQIFDQMTWLSKDSIHASNKTSFTSNSLEFVIFNGFDENKLRKLVIHKNDQKAYLLWAKKFEKISRKSRNIRWPLEKEDLKSSWWLQVGHCRSPNDLSWSARPELQAEKISSKSFSLAAEERSKNYRSGSASSSNREGFCVSTNQSPKNLVINQTKSQQDTISTLAQSQENK